MKNGKMGGSLEDGLSEKSNFPSNGDAPGPVKDQKPVPTKRESVKKGGKSFTVC